MKNAASMKSEAKQQRIDDEIQMRRLRNIVKSERSAANMANKLDEVKRYRRVSDFRSAMIEEQVMGKNAKTDALNKQKLDILEETKMMIHEFKLSNGKQTRDSR